MRRARLGSRSSTSQRLPLIGRFVLWSLLAGFSFRADAQPQRDVTTASSDEALLRACEQSLACSRHLDRANSLYQDNQFAAALDEYLAAYVLQPYPLILYNIARLHHKQNHLQEASSYYQRYLDTRHPERTERARAYLAEIRKAAQEPEKEPVPVAVSQTPQTVVAAPLSPIPTAPHAPVYKKWWFWSLAGVTVAGAAITVGLVLAAKSPDVSSIPSMTFSF